MKAHPELGKRLHLAGYSADAELAEALTQVSAMVIPAFDDGFGLPLVEAAALGCPVVARDVPIYRETSGGDAFFFPDAGPREMAEKLKEWLALPRKKQLKFVPRTSLATWRQSAQIMQAILLSSAMAFTVDVGVNASLRLLAPPAGQKPS
jgi:glycosyltransferase involved in cell wall biosynthesis